MGESRSRIRLSLGALLGSHVLSRTGNVVTLFAIPFSVLALGGGPIDVGLAAFVATAPVILGGPLGGVLVDRVGYVRASVVADIVSGATIALIPILAVTVGLPFPVLLTLVFLGGLLDTPGETARRVMLPQISTAAGIRLERSVGFLDASTRLSSLLGAPAAGLLITALGAYPALTVTAVTFTLSALMTGLWVRMPGSAEPLEAPQNPEGYWQDLRAGFAFAVRDPLLRLIVAMVLITNLLDAARINTLLPLYATEYLNGPAALGLVLGVFGGGALVGSLTFGFFAHRMPRRITLAVCFTIAGGPSLVVPALGLGLEWMAPAAAISGLAAGAVNPILGAVQLERIPVHMRGRVYGLITAGAWAGIPLGGLLGGVSASVIGVTATFGVIAVIYTLATLWPLTGGNWRLMERSRIAPGEDPPASAPRVD
ncbi:MFS transporter [Mycetocola tolaasinivorans]|uniref:Multidrug efflux pump Tap n=1 Tax=Mycetocola tolaasinivorans TaxID=76635 RepID=A0A3L7A5L5_9MICO|nr:MFS transporter [Mycetocola tolaasinivorans]RLP75616.1 MFS transporter [Mycetocola tolaasinivorans]